MTHSENPLASRIRKGWWLLASGLLVFAAGWLLLYFSPELERAVRIVSGTGLMLTIVGAVQVVQYRMLSRDKATARRVAVSESDERSTLIRLRGATRGFVVAITMIFAALMWVSASLGVGEGVIAGDALWYYLAACVVVPLGVYIASVLWDDRTL